MMIVRGVRSSWLSTLRNSDLARLALSAALRASVSSGRPPAFEPGPVGPDPFEPGPVKKPKGPKGSAGETPDEVGSPSPVPLPAGLPLLLGALGAFATLRRLNRRV